MRVAFCGGGTGGHVYPALTVASSLRRLYGSSLELLYLGVAGKIDAELVVREHIPFRGVNAAPLRDRNPIAAAKGGLTVLSGAAQATMILRKFRPDVVFATGGYGSVGVAYAAKLLKRPILLFLPDVEAGLAVRNLVRIATRIAVTVPRAAEAMPADKTVVTGYPVRPAFFEADRDSARQTLGLDAGLPVLLVSGASTGATAINQAIAAAAPVLLHTAQIVHLCGRADEVWLQSERSRLPADLQSRYHLHAYLHDDMALALAAADLAVMRSGASVIGELPAAGLPAVLVPLTIGHGQMQNARYLENAGGAIVLPQPDLAQLQSTVSSLLADSARLTAMRASMSSLAQPDAADNLAHLIAAVAGAKTGVAA